MHLAIAAKNNQTNSRADTVSLDQSYVSGEKKRDYMSSPCYIAPTPSSLRPATPGLKPYGARPRRHAEPATHVHPSHIGDLPAAAQDAADHCLCGR